MVTRSPVCSYNEWDPLEEVVVGRLEGARIPSRHLTVTFNIPQRLMKIYKLIAGLPYPKFVVRPAQRELDEFIHILEAEGVTVRRPAVTDFSVTYKTPHWKSKGFCSACPRDGLLVVGDEIIETPMAWRSRYFEVDAYRPLLKEYTASRGEVDHPAAPGAGRCALQPRLSPPRGGRADPLRRQRV